MIVPAFLPPTQEPKPALSSFGDIEYSTNKAEAIIRTALCLRLKTDGNERKMPLPFSFPYLFYENGSRSRTTGSENGSGINGNAKTDKYDRKIDGNKRYAKT